MQANLPFDFSLDDAHVTCSLIYLHSSMTNPNSVGWQNEITCPRDFLKKRSSIKGKYRVGTRRRGRKNKRCGRHERHIRILFHWKDNKKYRIHFGGKNDKFSK